MESSYVAGRQIAADTSITAVYRANDEMAFGLMHALYEQARRMPQGVSVVGFDGIPLSEFGSPPLTTVKQGRLGSSVRAARLSVVGLVGLGNMADGRRSPSLNGGGTRGS